MPQFIKFNKQTEESYWVTGVPRITKNPVFISAMEKFGCTVSDIQDYVPESPVIAFSLAVPPGNIDEVKTWFNNNASPSLTAPDPTMQSANWDDMSLLISKNPNQRIPGFPFSVPFPAMYGGQEYDIITVNGERKRARVDDAREYMSEGLEWKTLGKDSEGNIEQAGVAAWKRRPQT